MLPDERDTIAAIATAVGAAERGVVRVAGPDALRVVAGELTPAGASELRSLKRPSVLPAQDLSVQLVGQPRALTVDLYVWPDNRSYVRQPTVELHLPGSPPLCEAVLRSLCERGARLAEPGEFTLRAVLSGRLDLTQAEAVLGVIDARGAADLRVALDQLAGGLTAPLGRVREDLLGLLADIEAGLDFVDEEDVRFVEPEELSRRLAGALDLVGRAAEQASSRTLAEESPTVVLTGPPNAGKSTLFNLLRDRAGTDQQEQRALVSCTPGSTRDRLTATLAHNGLRFELVDTAGSCDETEAESLESAMQAARRSAVASATLLLVCRPCDLPTQPDALEHAGPLVEVRTKADLAPGRSEGLAVSAQDGSGLDRLLGAIAEHLDANLGQAGAAMVPSTAARCAESLSAARCSLSRALAIAEQGDELVALELRSALDGLGRVLGTVVTDDVLDRIFSRFCIGK